MATGACEKYGADYGLSVTGFAGPTGGTQVLPVGSIYLGYCSPVGFGRRNYIFAGIGLQTAGVLPLLRWTG